ncbi:hypothetical protein DSLASN_26410 [Desulfoluna limicola]|uniref:Lipase helper protein n=1 Tax=Desulfoluna limicola TaxID=2810562 RepID=A0ABM7PHF9_9BACT|nr:lipase chaperone [Desulfoluna limicola]BCS97009.1 hypothetical protein DSLASN_26410 [Desulfoluna limicola]
MTRKKVAALLGILAVAALLVVLRSGDPGRGKGYIFDRSHTIPVDAVKNLRKKVREPASHAMKIDPTATPRVPPPPLEIDGLLSDGLMNHETLRYLRFLHKKFRKSIDTAGHLEEIRGYLFSNLPLDEAREIYRLYSDYLACEMALTETAQLWSKPETPEDYIGLLRTMQEFRREYLGDDTADTLFGAEVKSREYAIRRAVIVHTSDMFGREKEALIKSLNTDIWGEDGAVIEGIHMPYNRYREKLAIYARDFEDMTSESDRATLTRELRESVFPPQVVARLEEVDEKLAREQNIETTYLQMEKEILDAPDLTPEEKTESIGALQDESFGDEAEAFRRRKAIQKGLESLTAGGGKT